MPRPRKDVARRRQNLQQRRDASTGRLVSNEDLETIREKMKAKNNSSWIEDALLSFESQFMRLKWTSEADKSLRSKQRKVYHGFGVSL